MRLKRTPECIEWYESQRPKEKAQIAKRLANIEEHGEEIKMGKTQTSSKREKSSKNTLKAKANAKPRLKTGSQAYDYSAASELANRKFISDAIADALLDGDADAIREILLSHLEQVHKDNFYKDAGISRRALFKLMEPDANPTLESLAKVCRALAKAA